MFTDYYKILGVSRYASDQEIKSAYRAMSMKWHPDKNPNVDVTSIMQDINEAYAILKDKNKRERYDNEYDNFFKNVYNTSFEHSVENSSQKYKYDYEVKDDILKEDIAKAKQYAKKLVDEFFKSFKEASQHAAKGAWSEVKGYIYAGILLTILGGIVSNIVQITQDSSYTNNKYTSDYIETSDPTLDTTDTTEQNRGINYPVFHIPENWTQYILGNKAFSIAVPNTIELRKEYDAYTKELKNLDRVCDSNVVVFQQKGLSAKSPESYKHYCRVIAQYWKDDPGEFLRSNQTEAIDYETETLLFKLVEAELGGFSLLNDPSYRWIDINGIKAIEIKYRRTGNNHNTTCCTMYFIFNYSELVKTIVSYREQEKDLWDDAMDNIIKTFK